MNHELLAALRQAESAAWEALNTPSRDTATEAHRLIAAAMRIAEAQASGPRCEAPTCDNAVEYSGIGRHRLYCSDRCRKAAHRAKQQR
jgi:hypothetical protein